MVMRIGGLASGMDIDSIVGDLMKAERMPLNKLTQKKQILEWQRDDYRSMNSLLKELDDFISVTNSEGIGRQSTFLKKTITSSNENAVTARNINGTANINTTIGVTQLAEAAYMNSASNIRSDNTFDPNAKLSTQKTKLANVGTTLDGSFSFTIKAIQNDGTLGPTNTDGTVGKTFTFDPTAVSLNQVISEINNSNAGVSAFFDDKTGRISLIAKNTGDIGDNTQSEIELVDNTGTFMTGVLGLNNNNVDAANTTDAQGNKLGSLGKNAEFTINGLATERTSNTFQINGFEYTLKSVSANVNITSTTDTEGIFDGVVKFVDKYNQTIEKINGKISEERYRSYKPLSDEERESMTDKQAEMWDEKAKSGMLRNDSILSAGLNQMRMDIYGKVDGLDSGAVNQLAQIGIKTSSNYLEKGKLIIDEGKLREAINADPMAIYNLFNNDGEDASGNVVPEQRGIIDRLRATIKTTKTNIESRAGNVLKTNAQYTLGRNLDDIKNEISSFEDRLTQIEDRYWRQFTAMEKAIQKSNEQASYLMQQFG